MGATYGISLKEKANPPIADTALQAEHQPLTSQGSPSNIIELSPGAANLFSGHPEDKERFSLPVAITEVAPRKFLLANYQNIFLFDVNTNRISVVNVKMNGIEAKFVPTNFAFFPENGRLFIANYLGNDILEANFDLKEGEITILGRIRDEKTLSPEGVAFDGRFLASANYDGNNVQIFEKQGGEWKASCELSIPWAHGVAFLKGSLFATGLRERKLHKIDPVNCQVVGSVGSTGWENGEFLWPTGIAPFDSDSVLVSDAHTGLLTIVGAADLRIGRSYGGNGPGRTGLNMPYSAIVSDGGIWTTSTYGGRLLRIDISTGRADSWDVSSDRQWKSVFPRSAFLNGQGYEGYVRQGMDMDLGGQCYRASYAGVVACADYGSKTSFPSYFVQIAKAEHGYISISPQNTTAYYISERIDKSTPFSIGFDSWLIGDQVISPSGATSVKDLESRIRTQ